MFWKHNILSQISCLGQKFAKNWKCFSKIAKIGQNHLQHETF
jgi:fumarate hydratase class II